MYRPATIVAFISKGNAGLNDCLVVYDLKDFVKGWLSQWKRTLNTLALDQVSSSTAF